MQKWEYLIEVIPGDKLQAEKHLNTVGDKGWEAVAQWNIGDKHGILFKRKKD